MTKRRLRREDFVLISQASLKLIFNMLQRDAEEKGFVVRGEIAEMIKQEVNEAEEVFRRPDYKTPSVAVLVDRFGKPVKGYFYVLPETGSIVEWEEKHGKDATGLDSFQPHLAPHRWAVYGEIPAESLAELTVVFSTFPEPEVSGKV